MKRAEFINWLKANEWQIEENEDNVTILGSIQVQHMENEIMLFNITDWAMDADTVELFRIIADYCQTPIKDREANIKYRLKLPAPFNSRVGVLCESTIVYNSPNVFGANELKDTFTQGEIDKLFPNSNWLVKEKVD